MGNLRGIGAHSGAPPGPYDGCTQDAVTGRDRWVEWKRFPLFMGRTCHGHGDINRLDRQRLEDAELSGITQRDHISQPESSGGEQSPVFCFGPLQTAKIDEHLQIKL